MRRYDTETAVSVVSWWIRFLYVFFTIFVFRKNWLRTSVHPTSRVICCMWLLSTGNVTRSKHSSYNLRSLKGLRVTVDKTVIILQILVSCLWDCIAGRIAKLQEAQFAHGFLTGEDHRRISQVAVKQVRDLKIDELNNLSDYQEMKIKCNTWYVYKSFYICIMTG